MRTDNRASFDVVQAFQQINTKLDEIQKQMGTKAERDELEALRSQLENVRINGSGHAQEALKQLSDINAKVVALELRQVSQQSVEENTRRVDDLTRSSHQNSVKMWIAIGIAVVGWIVSLLIGFGTVAVDFYLHTKIH